MTYKTIMAEASKVFEELAGEKVGGISREVRATGASRRKKVRRREVKA